MLKRLFIKNLGSFGDDESVIDFSNETLMAGANNSGKSLALSAINFIRMQLMSGMPGGFGVPL